MLSQKLGVQENLRIKRIDLGKAYKQLPLADSALDDAFFVVYDVDSGKPKIFQSLVLPFGARAAVVGFCRTSRALWMLGIRILLLHGTVYFDDFIVVADQAECSHTSMILDSFFAMLGWETASDKGEEAFSPCAKALGVLFDFASARRCVHGSQHRHKTLRVVRLH